MNLRYAFGLIFCALLIFFAIGAKTAVYRPHQEQVANLTAAKVWQNTALPAVVSTPVTQTVILLAFALMLFATFFANIGEPRSERPTLATCSWFSPALSVRPPPSI